eukprot:TRINITY_DN831_c0_g2_i1.p1 TRINITY_DN831_c0_g2~~TRINITY_DN831_c0_g2_i1.p1  ORF type:complete len:367 (+),score=45.61 TRINITY_DN831_c0_g2_i1:1230-2330(+)
METTAQGVEQKPTVGEAHTFVSSTVLAYNLYFLFDSAFIEGVLCVSMANGWGILCTDSEVWTWGRNNCGQLGSGSTDYTTKPVHVEFQDKKVIWVGCSSNNTSYALTSEGELYAWGYNAYGEGGHCDTQNPSCTPRRSAPDKTILKVAIGDHHVIALTNTGDVVSWGSGGSGQLGNGGTSNQNSPVVVQNVSGKKIKEVYAANNHSAVLTKDGEVWIWGENSYYQLGVSGTQTRPYLIDKNLWKNKKIIQLSLSTTFTLALADDGTMFSWGNNGSGQLGTGNTTNYNAPVPVPFPNLITRVDCFNDLSVVRRSGGETWIFGNRHGKPCHPEIIPNPSASAAQIFLRQFNHYHFTVYVKPHTSSMQI